MSLLLAHLEQISLSCEGIDSLPFPPPKIFTNALLSKPDITSLIRDTEAHERALFSVPPPLPAATSANPDPPKPSSRRQTVFNVAAGEVTTGPPTNSASAASRFGAQPTTRRNTAVAAVLGGDLHAQITRRKGEGEVDIEVLLRGAEKLCGVYALPGALERIPLLRQKWEMQSHTLEYYEAKIAEQMERMNLERNQWEEEEEEEEQEQVGGNYVTEEDLRREEEEARALDRKKRELQARLRALDSDLGGLM
ncbi:reticulocyte-binding protein 2 a [Podospora australis]|uniref:DASH complex subunit SPC34 n=1 Tax=Podospora australis TaxID=1536484 RepID=A0AAN6X1U4_9PEZI|nr:reticulocyte-binding protein 2 a [Podospora australis]